MNKRPPIAIWLIIVPLVVVAVVFLSHRPEHRIVIEDIKWEDHRAECTVSFSITNNSSKEQSVQIAIFAERTRESRAGTVIAPVGYKTIEVKLPPHDRKHLSYLLPLASAYSGSLIVRCVLAM